MNTGDQGGDIAETFLADAIVDEAVRGRRAANWSRRRALDEVTVRATLLESTGNEVALTLSTGDELRARVTLATDHVVCLDGAGATHWVRTDDVCAVRVRSGGAGQSIDSPVDTTLEALLADLVDGGGRVDVWLCGGAALHGEVTAVGASLVLSDPTTGWTSVAELDSVIRVSFPN